MNKMNRGGSNSPPVNLVHPEASQKPWRSGHRDAASDVLRTSHDREEVAEAEGHSGQQAWLTPDAECVLPDGDAGAHGRCLLWWRRQPLNARQVIGFIGGFKACVGHSAKGLLALACKRLAAEGCHIAYGPIDGSTWHTYRLVTEQGEEPPFFLEPNHPCTWPRFFLESGFAPALKYYSAFDDNLDEHRKFSAEVARQMARREISVRAIDLAEFDKELARFHNIATKSFCRHELYQAIDLADFRQLYRPLREIMDQDLVLIAECDGEPAGFLFAIPDWLQSSRGGPVTTVVVKSIAVLPGQAYAGLGYYLLDCLRGIAAEAGYTRLVYAMMRDVGYMRRRISAFAKPMRRYALFARCLEP